MRYFERYRICFQVLFFLLFLPLSFSLSAGDPTYLVEVTSLGKINVTNGGLIEGEHIDVRTGTLYWETTDLVIPGNGKLDIAVNRSFNKTAFSTVGDVSDWNLEIPRILIALEGNPAGSGEVQSPAWKFKDPQTWKGNLCERPFSNMYGRFVGFWAGLQLVIPGESPRELHFIYKEQSKQFPATVKYATTDNWTVECRASDELKALLNNMDDASFKATHQNDKDVFLVTAPDGRRFWLDVVERQQGHCYVDMVVREGYLCRDVDFNPSWVIVRASKVEDVHGNYLQYDYHSIQYEPFGTGRVKDTFQRLEKITSNDGRVVEFFYDESPEKKGLHLEKITANGKSWLYQYPKNKLTKVIRPDGTAWQYQYEGPQIFSYGNYIAPHYLSRVETPSGATIDYAFQKVQAGAFIGVHAGYSVPFLSSRTAKGPGLKEGNWKYQGSDRDGRDGFVIMTIEAPEHREVHEFFRRRDWRMGLPYSKRIYARGSNAPLRQEIYEWTVQPQFGDSGIPRHPDFLFLSNGAQNILTKVTIDGKYTTQYQGHDIYGNPQKITETGTDTKTTQRTYLNKTDANLWLIGLPKDEHIEGAGSILREHDEKGNLTKLTEYGITTTFDYHSTGDLKSKTTQKDGLAQTTFFDNYHRGQAQTITKPENVVLRKTINDTGTVASETDGEGHTTTYAYDALNRLIQITPPIQVPTTIEWKNPRTKVITKARYQETVTMDPFERPLTKDKVDTHANEHILAKTEYDGEGRMIYQSDPLSTQGPETGTRTTLDGLGRPTQLTHTGDGSTTAYTYEGDKVLITRPNGFKTQARYRILGDPKNKELLETNEQITKEVWKTTTLTRDKLGNITSVKQGPITRLFQFEKDRPKLLQRQYDPEIGWINYTYDGVGNKTSETIENQEATKFHYDNLNRLTEIDYHKETPDVFYQYDKDNHVTELKKGETAWRYQYNERGQLTEEHLEVGKEKSQFNYHYDNEGNQESLTYPTGMAILYKPDAFGRPTELGEYLKNINYFPNGLLKTFYTKSDLLTQFTQNKRHWPESILTQKDKKPLVTQTYQYDLEGNLTQAQVQNNTQSFTYDGLNQLTAAKGPWGEASFQYDTTGNILQKTIGKEALTYAYSPDQNRLTKITGTQNKELIYDDRGNLSVKGKELFSFDEARNLTALLGINIKTLYQYDGNNHRTVIQKGKETTYTIHNQAGQLLVEYTPNQSKTYLYHNHQLIARIEKTGNQEAIHYYHTDNLGSPIAQSDSKGNLEWQETYAPYGKRMLRQGNDNQQWYTGKTEDTETGFIYLNARYYDPEIGRFISPDPVHFTEENPLSFNRYAYANNNPLKFVDPDGRDAIYIHYDWYPVSTPLGKLPLGHGAVVAVNPTNGATKYYEFGRYYGIQRGLVRSSSTPLPRVRFGEDGEPTSSSLNKLYNHLSMSYGEGKSVSATYFPDSDYRGTINFTERFRRHHPDYNLFDNNCKTFAWRAATACQEGQSCN